MFKPISLYRWTCLSCTRERRGRKNSWKPKYKANRSLHEHKKNKHSGEKITILFEKVCKRTGKKTIVMELL